MLIKTDSCSDSKQVLKLYAFSLSVSMNISISKCNKQHSNPNNAEVKKIVSFSQTNKIELLLVKATFKLLKST